MAASTFDSLELARLVAGTGQALHRGPLFQLACERAGISLDSPSIRILSVLRRSDRQPRIGEIAAELKVEGPHITRTVQKLSEKGLIQRNADPDDKRASCIALTAKGTDQIDRYLAVVRTWFDDALGTWSEEDKEQLTTLVRRWSGDIIGYLDRLEDTETPEPDRAANRENLEKTLGPAAG